MTSFIHFLEQIDLFFFRHLNFEWSHDFFDIFFPVITDLHKIVYFKAIFLPFVLALLFYYRKWNGVIIFFSMAVTIGIGDFIGGRIKHLVERARPFDAAINAIQRSDAGGHSFPSNHALNIFCAAMFLSFFFPRYRYWFFSFAVLIAVSRVYNGVHYPSDVLGGMLLGILMGYLGSQLCRKLIEALEKRKKKNV